MLLNFLDCILTTVLFITADQGSEIVRSRDSELTHQITFVFDPSGVSKHLEIFLIHLFTADHDLIPLLIILSYFSQLQLFLRNRNTKDDFHLTCFKSAVSCILSIIKKKARKGQQVSEREQWKWQNYDSQVFSKGKNALQRLICIKYDTLFMNLIKIGSWSERACTLPTTAIPFSPQQKQAFSTVSPCYNF